jgi:Family of unknown function (DUF6401)
MASVLAAVVDTAVNLSAAAAVRRLWEGLGASGWAAAQASPALSAMVDQHSAAVRDALSIAGVGGIGVAALAGYARGLVEVAGSPHPADVDWSRPGWRELRLTAVCTLARHHGHLPASA